MWKCQICAIMSSSNTVFATCRSPTTALGLDALKSISKLAVQKVLELLNGTWLDCVINNVAINPGGDLPFSFDPAVLAKTIKCNFTGPALVTRFLLPAIENSSRIIVNISSSLASTSKNLRPKLTSYSINNAGLDMLTYKQISERPHFISILIDPGWVKTDMGGKGVVIEPHVSVTGILNVVTKLTSADMCKFYNYMGEAESVIPMQ
ncbi:hypothetical protein EDB19DRAFT_1898256 [Suillus lakei]|nr:hypothetical protein EDB19DRAFT_1898256 [Suillus lakei]